MHFSTHSGTLRRNSPTPPPPPQGRCYPIFMSLSECAAASKNRDACDELRDDYFECLHHRKETMRLNDLTAERERRKKAGEPVPPTLAQEKAAGDLKIPWTKATE